MNFITLLFIAAQAMQDAQMSFSSTAMLVKPDPQCTLSYKARDIKCDPGARVIEILSITRPGEQELRCEVVEMLRDGEWQVWDARLYCRRVPK